MSLKASAFVSKDRSLYYWQIASLTGLNRNSVNRLLTHIRTVIATSCEAASPLSGEVELDESYFGPRRVRGRRGSGAGKKVIVFGLLKRHGKVYTQILSNASRETLKQIVQAKVEPDATIYSDGWSNEYLFRHKTCTHTHRPQ